MIDRAALECKKVISEKLKSEEPEYVEESFVEETFFDSLAVLGDSVEESVVESEESVESFLKLCDKGYSAIICRTLFNLMESSIPSASPRCIAL